MTFLQPNQIGHNNKKQENSFGFLHIFWRVEKTFLESQFRIKV